MPPGVAGRFSFSALGSSECFPDVTFFALRLVRTVSFRFNINVMPRVRPVSFTKYLHRRWIFLMPLACPGVLTLWTYHLAFVKFLPIQNASILVNAVVPPIHVSDHTCLFMLLEGRCQCPLGIAIA